MGKGRLLKPFETAAIPVSADVVRRVNHFPVARRDAAGVMQVVQRASDAIGLDLEFDSATGTPTLIGVANDRECAAAPWTDNLMDAILKAGRTMVGHAILSADVPIIEARLGRSVGPSASFEDTLILGYLDNQDWCSKPGKTEEEGEKGTVGLMGLRTMGPYYSGLPQWKVCRGAACYGPCPVHDQVWYCAVDAWAALRVYRETEMCVSWVLYEDLKRLSLYCLRMQEQGIAVDLDVVARMQQDIDDRKAELFPSEMRLPSERARRERRYWLTPFNPNSPKQKLEYFAKHGIVFPDDSVSKENVRRVLERELRRHHVSYEIGEDGLIHVTDPDIEIPEPLEYLLRLDGYARAGKGLSSWFDERYVDRSGPVPLIHPRFIVTGTSTGRLASSRPNFQNVPKRGAMSAVRAAIIPRSPRLDLAKADKAQLELRVVLYYAGERQPDRDAFSWLVQESKGLFREAASRLSATERDIAKSVSHAANYLEGLVVLDEEELRSKTRQREIAAGALEVHEDWEYEGGVVCFTGANLAERLFGDRSYTHRREALELQRRYFSLFPGIRSWHRQLSAEIQSSGMVRSATGRYLRLYGTPEENLKLAAAFLGQGGGADEVQEGMLRYDSMGRVAIVQVHDELVFEVPRDWSDDEVLRFFSVFEEPSTRFGGIRFPVEVSRGRNWASASDVNPEGMRKLGRKS